MTEYRQLQQLAKTVRQLDGEQWFTVKAPKGKLEQLVKSVKTEPSFTTLTSQRVTVNLKEILKKGLTN